MTDSTVYVQHRVEPISREGDPGRGLAAPVHDPLWTLGRQRAFGELTGEDTGSPIQVDFRLRTDPIDGWFPADADAQAQRYDPAIDVLDAAVAGEAAGPAHSVRDRVDAGRRLRQLLPDIADAALAAFPIAVNDRGERLLARAAARFPDGLGVATTILALGGDSDLAAALGVDEATVTTNRVVLDQFARWATTTFGMTPNTWIPERLERRFGLSVAGVPALSAPVHTRAVVDAPDLVLTPDSATLAVPTPDTPLTKRIPTPVRFPGMPNDRFWEFEDAQLALHRIDAATHDLARLALVEYSSIYGNDWYSFPVPLAFGTVATMTELVVRDVFGTTELVRQVDDVAWSMYQPTQPGNVPQRLVIPAVSVGTLSGPVVEEVSFVRDENADLVWGLEKIVTDPNGRIRDLVAEFSAAQRPADPLPTDAELLYRLMTEVPEHWIPFIPVHLGPDNRAVGLVEAVLPRPNTWGDLVTVAPRSSILQELAGTVLHEEEVPSDGVTVRRRWYLTRSADGGRHVWAARDVTTGRGEGESGLVFDITIDMRGGHG
jgi:hypothetical protein